MVVEGRSDKVVSYTEICRKQGLVIEFLHEEEMGSTDIHRHLLRVGGDQTVDVSTVRWWVVCFSSGGCDMRNKLHSRWTCTAVTVQNEEGLDQLIHVNWQIKIRQQSVWSRILASVCWKWWQG